MFYKTLHDSALLCTHMGTYTIQQTDGKSFFTKGHILSSSILDLSQVARQYHKVGGAY